MSKIEEIDSELLERYINCIIYMEYSREIDTDFYVKADRKREELHNEILSSLEIDRNDKNFNMELSFYVTKVLGFCK